MSHKTDIFEKDGQDGPSNVVKQDPDEDEIEDLVKFAGSEIGFLESALDKKELAKHSSSPEWEWEHYQYNYFDRTGSFICNKPRRVGISTAFAAKAFARGMLSKHTDYTAIFVSHKQDDAQKKIEYVRNFLEALPPRFERDILRDPLQLIEWENKSGTRTKIVSHPQKPVRGDDGDIFLDEFAHYQRDKKIWDSVLNATGMGDFSIDITSTPFGKSGLFYKIMTQPNEFPDFDRQQLFWWDCKRYLREDHDISQDLFMQFAKQKIENEEIYQKSLEERVYEFGNENLKRLYRNNTDESFKQELEAHFVDKQATFIDKDLIMSNMFLVEDNSLDHYDPKEGDFNISVEDAVKKEKWPIEEKYSGQLFTVYNRTGSRNDYPEQLYSAVDRNEITGKLIGGVDLGTSRHSTEFVVLEEVEIEKGRTLQIERFRLTKKNWDLDDQQKYFEKILRHGYVKKLRVDCTGLGTQLGQYLEKHFDKNRFVPLVMNSAKKKDREMTNLKHRFRQNLLAIAYSEEKVLDIHSINRVTTQAGNVTYRASERNKSHADFAWALSFASNGGTPLGESQLDRSAANIADFEIDKTKDKRPISRPYVEDFNKRLNEELGGDFQGPNSFEEQIAKGLDDPGDFIDI